MTRFAKTHLGRCSGAKSIFLIKIFYNTITQIPSPTLKAGWENSFQWVFYSFIHLMFIKCQIVLVTRIQT